MDIKKEYERWLANATADADVAAELKTLDDAKVEDAFYRDLAFGTGGLRGVIGAGTNRMNIYTVAKASQGLADYLKKNFAEPSVAIGYDSRIKSDVFAKVAAGVFAANGVKVNIWPVLMPVPTVSFATRYLHTSAGVMVTASHNPGKYNGYKVYGADGCQITTEAAAEILAEIEKLDIFADVKTSDFEAGVTSGNIQYIPDEVYTAFVNEVKNQSVLFGEEVNKDVAIVYSPLNGTGLKPVTRTLKEMGYYGFDHEISKAEFEERIKNNTLTEVLNAVPVHKGDCFFIPAGTLHAICKGIVIAEVQQNSNVTYRVYDYGRVGADGKPRALHVEKALDVTLRTPPVKHDFGNHLAQGEYFTVDAKNGAFEDTADEKSFVSLLVTDGEGELTCGGETVVVKKGDSFFLPAGSGSYAVRGTCQTLVTRV